MKPISIIKFNCAIKVALNDFFKNVKEKKNRHAGENSIERRSWLVWCQPAVINLTSESEPIFFLFTWHLISRCFVV